MYKARDVLQRITWKKSEENEISEIISVKWLGNEFKYVNISAEITTAYGSPINRYNICNT